MFVKDMADAKEFSMTPTVIVQSQEAKPKMSPTKKYVIIGVFSFLLIGLLLTGILVGMHIFTQAQKELVEFTLKLNGDRSQEVTSDSTNNIVKYHTQDNEREAWVINDFNTDIKVTKVISSGDVNCYLTPLNRSIAMEPSEVTKPDSNMDVDDFPKDTIVYTVTGEPVSDISFLNKEARTMCKGVSTYWMYPKCGKGLQPHSSPTNPISKREAPYYVLSHVEQNGTEFPCINGCCTTVCGCKITYLWLVIRNHFYCFWHTYECCPSTNLCYYSETCEETPGLNCTTCDN